MEQYNYMPIGTVVSYAGATTPIGWLLCDGRTIEEHEYPDLYRVLGSGVLPDLRGEFVRGLDNGRGLDGGRVLGSEQGDAIRNITGSIDVSAYADTAGSNIIVGHQGVFGNLGNTVTGEPVSAISYTGSKPRNRASIDASRQVPTAEENRPKNVALNYIIKAFNTTTDTETLPIQMAKALNNKIENNYNDQLDATVDIVGKEFYDYIQNPGEKTAGKIYRDRLQKGIFRCLKTTTSVLNTSEFYENCDLISKAKIKSIEICRLTLDAGQSSEVKLFDSYEDEDLFICELPNSTTTADGRNSTRTTQVVTKSMLKDCITMNIKGEAPNVSGVGIFVNIKLNGNMLSNVTSSNPGICSYTAPIVIVIYKIL